MVTIDNLVTTAIKVILNKNQRADSITTVAFMNKTRNYYIQPEMIEERIEWLIKNGTIINKPFNSHASYRLTGKYITSTTKNLKIILNTKEDHLTYALMKTPNHPSSIVTPLLTSQQSNNHEMKFKLNLSIRCD